MPRMLSSADKRHFVEHGYLVRQLPFDAAVFARAIDLAWQHLDPQLVRDDPASWRTDCAITDSCHTRTMSERRGRVKLRECVHPVGWLGDVIHGDPRILEMVREGARQAGRDPDALRIVVRSLVDLADADPGPDRRPLHGTPEQVLEDFAMLRAQGVTEVFVDLNFMPRVGSPDVDAGKATAEAEHVLEALAPAHVSA